MGTASSSATKAARTDLVPDRDPVRHPAVMRHDGSPSHDSGNAPAGAMVAGSNPVSPTESKPPPDRRFCRSAGGFSLFASRLTSISAFVETAADGPMWGRSETIHVVRRDAGQAPPPPGLLPGHTGPYADTEYLRRARQTCAPPACCRHNGGVDPRLVELSRTIDAAELGRRIRNARLAAGMTQPQVAGDEVSAAYLSRIEDGQRRPEVGLLSRMAERMGTTLEALVGTAPDKLHELRLQLDHAELYLVSGQPGRALDLADAVVEASQEINDVALATAALRVRARSLEGIGRLDEAIVLLEDLTDKPRSDAGWLKDLIALSRCYRETGDLLEAIAIGEKASATIEELGLDGLTEAIQLSVTVAAAYHEKGDVGQAVRICMRAIDAAERQGSLVAKASAYWNASIFEADANGATPDALRLAQRALMLFEQADDNRNLAKLRAEMANLHLSMDPPDPRTAVSILDRAEEELVLSGGSAAEAARVHVTRARALLLLGDLQGASDAARLGKDLSPESASLLRACAEAIRGKVAAMRGESEQARARYRESVLALTAAGSDRGAARLWFELAELLAEAGDTQGAMDAYRSAAASSGLGTQAAPALIPRVTAERSS
ncbi:helix-turn-helix domain-containing protein [Nocardioides sp.]|nr:helix-turn-helix domain-containing protein [Nocardioides sp.]